MSIKNGEKVGGSAFPVAGSGPQGTGKVDGMSLRDYFAAKAMQGIVSTVPHHSCVDPRDVAEEAYQFADAMLAERAK